jgi:hypothetical protein
MRAGVLLVSLLALAGAVAQAHDSAGHAADHSSLDLRMAALGAPPRAPPARALAPVEYPFKSFRRRGDLPAPAERLTRVRLHEGRRRALRPFPGLVGGRQARGRRAAAVRDMTRGAEAYLQSWERVEGVRFGCKSGRQRARRGGMGRIRLGDSAEALLRRAGQPRVRGNRAWSWCARGTKNRGRRIAAVLTPDGSVALAGSSARGSEAQRIRVGDSASRLDGVARGIGKGLFARRAGRARFVLARANAMFGSWRWRRAPRRRAAGPCVTT